MIAENFGIYFIAFCLSGSIFTYTMEKLEHFRKKLVIFAGIAVLLGCSVFFLPEKNTFLIEAAFMCVGCVLMVIMLHSCWDVSWSVAWYNMIWGISIWEVVIEGTSMLIFFRRMYRPDALGEKAIIIGAYLSAYLLCAVTISKWMPIGRKRHLGPRQMSLSVLLSVVYWSDHTDSRGFD